MIGENSYSDGINVFIIFIKETSGGTSPAEFIS
jgi:hypothetical protein